MSFRRHKHYRAVNLPHLTEVPSHWDLLPNKALFSQVHRSVGEDWSRTQLLSLSLRGIVARDIDSGEGKYPSDFGTYQCVEPGDLVFCLFDMDETPRTVGLSALAGMITGAYDVVRCRPRAVPSYVHYYYLYIDSFKGLRPFYTGLRKVVRPPTFMAIGMPVPPIAEQSDIASFLDQETSKIDALISEQQRLIELLKEKRQAVISHAVTKGLNPDVRMKPSGVEWLGEVPEHWEVRPLKFFIEGIESGTSVNAADAPAGEGEIGVLKTSCVYTGIFNACENKVVVESERDRASCPLRAGSLIVSRMNTPELVGAAGYVSHAPTNIFLPDRLWQVLLKHVEPRFVHFWTMSELYRGQVAAMCTGTSSSMKNLAQDQFRNLVFVSPPPAEQKFIVESLITQEAQTSALLDTAGRAIALLQERRTALISAAVTGKIDVRNYAATQKDAA